MRFSDQLCIKKHVFCEKPGGIHSIEVNTREARKNRVVYAVRFNHRYHPAFLLAKKLLNRGVIEKILFIRVRYGFGGKLGYQKEWRFQKKLSGGFFLIYCPEDKRDVVRRVFMDCRLKEVPFVVETSGSQIILV